MTSVRDAGSDLPARLRRLELAVSHKVFGRRDGRHPSLVLGHGVEEVEEAERFVPQTQHRVAAQPVAHVGPGADQHVGRQSLQDLAGLCVPEAPHVVQVAVGDHHAVQVTAAVLRDARGELCE